MIADKRKPFLFFSGYTVTESRLDSGGVKNAKVAVSKALDQTWEGQPMPSRLQGSHDPDADLATLDAKQSRHASRAVKPGLRRSLGPAQQ